MGAAVLQHPDLAMLVPRDDHRHIADMGGLNNRQI